MGPRIRLHRGFAIAAGSALIALPMLLGVGSTRAQASGGSTAGITVASSVPGSDQMAATPAPPAPPSDRPGLSNPPKPAASTPPAVGGSGLAKTATSGGGAMAALAITPPSTLILYDTSGDWGWLGGLYAQEAANLTSHFGSWTAEPVKSYTSGQIGAYTATIYIGSTYDEPLPTSFLSDVSTASKPVIWLYDNIWQLETYMGYNPFGYKYGWEPGAYDLNSISTVNYKGTALTRDPDNGAGVLNVQTVGWANKTPQILATATEDGTGTSIPWATTSAGLTYIGEIPFSYTSETDRFLAYSDLLFNYLAPSTATQHRAIVRLEDISPNSDPKQVQADADWLYSQHIPFGFAVIPWYKDPLGYYTNGRAVSQKLPTDKKLISVLQYLESHGGTLIEHGYTHQWDTAINPFDEVTGDDYEFYRVTQNSDETLTYQGPLPGDSVSADALRISSSTQMLQKAKLGTPTIWETPHYAGSAATYTAVRNAFSEKWERTLYFAGFWGGTPDYTPSHLGGEFFPYVVKDVYGLKTLPENLGNIEPQPWEIYPARLPADLINAAAKNLVVRDGFAAFYFHPDYSLTYLQQTVAGIRNLGYSFVDPAGL